MLSKKTARVLLVISGLFIVALIGASLLHKGSTQTSPPAGTNQQPAPRVSPPSSLVIAPKKAIGDKPTKDDAVVAAAQATSRVSEAVLLPKAQMRQVIESLVAPNLRQTVEKRYLVAAQALSRALNYTTVSEAQANANYYVVTQKYLVRGFGHGHATVWLYNITHFVTPSDQKTVQNYAVTHPGQTPPNQEYYVPSITIVRMQWLNGHWLWAGTKDPPADRVPPPKGHPTFQQAVNAYIPYVRSFKNYADLQ